MTEVLLLAMALTHQEVPTPTFNMRTEIQGLYDEISQVTAPDADLFHDVLYTADWTYVDMPGQRWTWSQIREGAIQVLSAPPPDSLTQTIEKLSLVADGAIADVTLTTVRTVVDEEGRYGRPGAAHTLTEKTMFRDRWVHWSDGWKMQSRAKLSEPIVSVDKPEWSAAGRTFPLHAEGTD